MENAKIQNATFWVIFKQCGLHSKSKMTKKSDFIVVQGYNFKRSLVSQHVDFHNLLFSDMWIDGGGVAINDGLDKRQILHECETFFLS